MKTFSIYNNDQRGVSWQLFCEYGEISGGSRGGAPGGPGSPLFLDQTAARRAEQILFETGLPLN